MKLPEFLQPATLAKFTLTVTLVIAGFYAGRQLWIHYEVDPWTRDGRIRADITIIAPDVSGLVTKVYVQDNQDVKAGDLLFEIDTARFTLNQAQAKASLHAAQVAYEQARRDTQRNRELGALVSAEVLEQSQLRLKQSEAAVAQNQVLLETAELNLSRSQVHAVVNGRITNLDLRNGTYATAGRPVLALVDGSSFYVEGYFEETKISRIHEGDKAKIILMGDNRVMHGTVQSIALGIADRDRSTNSSNLLANVNPNFNWVRLAQRIPVRIKLEQIPEGLRLVSGQTATVAIDE